MKTSKEIYENSTKEPESKFGKMEVFKHGGMWKIRDSKNGIHSPDFSTWQGAYETALEASERFFPESCNCIGCHIGCYCVRQAIT